MQVLTGLGLGLVVLLQLAACATPLAEYQPPDASRQSVARLRILADPGVSAEVRIHPGRDDACLGYDGARRVPMPTGNERPGHLSGMPLAGGDQHRAGTDTLVAADAPLTLSVAYSGKDDSRLVACSRALRFTPVAGRDYRLYVSPEPQSGTQTPPCTLSLSEVPTAFSGPASALPEVVREDIAVKGSPAWKARCEGAAARDR